MFIFAELFIESMFNSVQKSLLKVKKCGHVIKSMKGSVTPLLSNKVLLTTLISSSANQNNRASFEY